MNSHREKQVRRVRVKVPAIFGRTTVFCFCRDPAMTTVTRDACEPYDLETLMIFIN